MINDYWVIISASVVAMACSLPGCFMLMRGMSMLVDGISHAVLPGIVIGYILTGSLHATGLLIGATLAGLLAVWLMEKVSQRHRLKPDAGIGVIYTAFFAIGVILISSVTYHTDLDQECVLYGDISHILFDQLRISNSFFIPKPLLSSAAVLLLNILFIWIFYRQLVIMVFDPVFASSIGIRVHLLHYLLTTLICFSAVASFETAGSILVITFFTALPATAYLWARSLPSMLVLCVLISLFSSYVGYYIAAYWGGAVAGGIVLCIGILFLLSVILSPKRGLLNKKVD